MKKIYFKSMLLLAMFAISFGAGAQEPPIAPGGDVVTAGKTYTFFTYSKLSSQMTRTSWDGAIYSPNSGVQQFTVSLSAEQINGDSWSFYHDVVAEDNTVTRNYLNIPNGSGNLNINATEPTLWNITPAKLDGFYLVEVGEGNNTAAIGYHIHMNAGNEYVVASYVGNSWYPDFYGGVLKDENGDDVYLSDEDDRLVMGDSSSCYWAFVEVDKVPEFLVKANGFATLNRYHKTYLVDDSYADYAEGFTVSYNAALALYKNAEFTEEDANAITAQLNAKIALYAQIQQAQLIENPDVALSDAITNAESSFKTVTATEDVEAATAALAKAVSDFNLGLGDVTGLGKNMSFEDLSAQNGSTTSSVEGAPTGWNVYVNGKQVSTAAEVKSAGFNAWHGVNGDGNGEGKDGDYIFGIWNSAIPTYELSQTIEGLENGTYTISAGLMVGANGNGSRRTTQRIFGNLNSTYFGYESDYNLEELDVTEVYSFQGNEEPVTDTELLPISVKAYVYDGTLTFGVRTDGRISAANRTSMNGSGGDGWFKLDNFTIHKDGYNVEDAMQILNFYKENLNQIVDNDDQLMSGTVRQEGAEMVTAAEAVTVSSSAETINSMILSLKDAVDAAYKSARDYNRLVDAIEEAYENLEKYDSKAGVGEYADVIAEIEDKLLNQEYNTAEEIDAAIQELAEALQACIESDTIEAGTDLTEYIKNRSFEDVSGQQNPNSGGIDNVPNGWNLVLNGTEVRTPAEITEAGGITAWCAVNQGDNINIEYDGQTYTQQYTDGTHLWGIWNDRVPEVELYQVLNLPAGVYTLTCDMMVEHNWAGVNITTQRLFANESVQMWARDTDYGENFTTDMQYAQVLQAYNTSNEISYFSYAGYDNDVQGSYTSLLRPMSVTFRVGEDGKAKIGMRTNAIDMNGTERPIAGAGWFKVDNFRLTCNSVGLIELPALPDAIEYVNVEKGTAPIYDIAGRRVQSSLKDGQLTKGIYIQNGQKFMVK